MIGGAVVIADVVVNRVLVVERRLVTMVVDVIFAVEDV
jgi:hypothetical protein